MALLNAAFESGRRDNPKPMFIWILETSLFLPLIGRILQWW
jgi:hypothetical protein